MIFQHLPVKRKAKNLETNRMRNGYIIDTSTSVDFKEIVKTGETVIEIYERVICRENFKMSPFRKNVERLFALGQKNKDERIDIMRNLLKLIMNILFGVQIRKDINECYKNKSEHRMQTEYDESVLD